MKRTDRLWRVLEAAPRLATSRAEWEHWLGPEIAWAGRWLKLTDRLAASAPGPDGQPWEAVRHNNGRCVLASPEVEGSIPIAREALAIQVFDIASLCESLGGCFGLESISPRELTPGVWTIGRAPGEDRSCAVLLALAAQDGNPVPAATVTEAVREPAVVAFTSTRHLTTSDHAALRQRHLVPLDLTVDLHVDRRGGLHLTRALDHWAATALALSTERSIDEEIAGLSALARRVIKELSRRGCIGPAPVRPSQNAIAKWLSRKFDSNFKAMLASLKRSGFLGNMADHGRRGGYYVAPKGVAAARLLDRS